MVRKLIRCPGTGPHDTFQGRREPLMSEEKKAYVSAPYGAQEPKDAVAQGRDKLVPGTAAEETDALADGERPNTQGVLPGILGKQLRAAYGELLNNPVPDRFNDLLKKLQESEAKAAKSSRDGEEKK
jgi:hypothetical protein